MQNQDIVCLSNASWFGLYATSTVLLMERMARNNRVVFVERHHTWLDIWHTIRGRQYAPIARMLGLKPRMQRLSSPVGTPVYHLVMPPAIPVFFLKNERRFERQFAINARLYQRVLIKHLDKLGVVSPLVVTAYNPFYGLAMLGHLNERAHVYYCYDGLEPIQYGQRVYRYDEAFSRRADAVICSSEHLGNLKRPYNANTFVVKNGVDAAFFSKQAKTEPYGRKRRKVGFIGRMDHRFDVDTVEYAVRTLTDFDFEFTGDMKNEYARNRLKDYPNVEFFNPVKPKEVPALLNRYDVGIIPYQINEVNRSIYPLKINEFLAVGVPVVMNAFADLPEFQRFVTVASSMEDFVKGLKRACQEDSVERIKQRIVFATYNDWEKRTEQFSNILENLASG